MASSMHTDGEVTDMRRLEWISGWGARVSFCVALTAAACFAQGAPPYGQAQGSPEPWSEQPPAGQGGPQDQQAPPDVAGPGVARISFSTGDVSVRRGDSGDPVAAAVNAPLLAGDILATGAGAARAEVQFDFANRLRLGHDTEARVAEMASGRFHVEMARGIGTFSVLRDSQAQVEISTPNVSVQPLQRGLYRVLVQDDGQTVITVRQGQADIYTERGTERINAGQTMYVRGTAQDPEFQTSAAIQFDEWDQWNQQRDQMLDHVNSYKYVSPDVYGVEDLDNYGQWQYDPAYGNVWSPQVDAGWSPYQLGRWAWEDYYGWTWVSADPWGWAPYHYGSWYRGGRGWCWYPGAIARPYFWRPALVAFFGFGGRGGVGFGFGNIGWVPLAPYERFSPWYGRGWGGGFANGRITNVNITNIYRNARVPGAVAGVSSNSFQNGNFHSISRVPSQQLGQAGLVRGQLPLAPTANNLRYSDRASTVTPRTAAGSNFYSRNPVTSANRVPFAQQSRGVSPNTRSSVGQVGQQPALRSADGGWSRFGAPGTSTVSPYRAGSSVAPAARQPATAGSSNWDRFGTPSRAPAATAQANGASTWQRFNGSSTAPPPARNNFAPAYGTGGSPRGESLRIAPPIVRDRSYGQPAYNAPAYSRQPSSYSRQPSYSAPRPTYSAPSNSRPQTYSAPRSTGGSAPHYSAPSGGSHGGGGESHSSGGGHHGR